MEHLAQTEPPWGISYFNLGLQILDFSKSFPTEVKFEVNIPLVKGILGKNLWLWG